MRNQKFHNPQTDPQYRFGAVRMHFNPEQLFQIPSNRPRRDQAHFHPYESAVQALRDVRHLLPGEGVAIVDAVLDSINARNSR
jgi:hypothetical protein